MARIFYNGNGSTSGTAPVDNTVYNAGDAVTLQSNSGGLARNADQYAYWNTAADGSGAVLFPGQQWTIGAADVTLFAQWYTTAGLTGGGTTTHYQFRYDSALAAGGLEPARTNTLISKCEADFALMKAWFGGIELSYAYPVSILVANLGGGASWGPPITLKGGGANANYLRDLLVAEVTEMFMLAQNRGWFAPDGSNEQSSGEGLSHFLNEQFEIQDSRQPGLAFNASIWLNSALPSSDPVSTRFGPPPTTFDYGARADYVNTVLEYDHSNSPASGCSVLFLWYLFTQLQFGVGAICQSAAPTLGGVYRNLSGDAADPFPFFKQLLDNAYPSDTAQNLPGPNPDNPFPLALVSFWVDKNSFGHDEVQDVLYTHAGRFTNAFWLVIEGFSVNTFNSLGVGVGAFSGSFTGLAGLSITRSATPIDFENPAQPGRLQRIRIAFDITFTAQSLATFPNTGDAARTLELDGAVTVGGSTPRGATAATIMALTPGANPYFTNIDPAQNNVFWLSQDLRVFAATPAKNAVPVAGGPAFGNDNVEGAFDYATRLISHLNTAYADPSGIDPFATLLPGQGGALAGDSSVTPVTVDVQFNGWIPDIKVYNNYNFAVARVRMRGLSGDVTPGVRVFFRLWTTQTADTDFQPSTTYLSTQAGVHPVSPLVGSGTRTIPFFATGNLGTHTDYVANGANNRDITLDIGDSKWIYYGCFLNVYDPANLVNGQPIQALLNGTHHCLVAEIACDTTPILNTATLTQSPENSDKLAQRNLQVTTSDNPGGAPSHRIPQTFDVRPSQALIDVSSSLLDHPDELMIDWGRTPVGAVAHIYWPQVDAADVLALAARLYSHQALTAGDAHTIDCTVTGGVTYVPIPPGVADGFAGLLTIDLPTTVVAGQELRVIVRRITSNRFLRKGVRKAPLPVLAGPATEPVAVVGAGTDVPDPKNDPHPVEDPAGDGPRTRRGRLNWRYVTGTFEIRIPVSTPDRLLAPERNTLAIMKWRLQQMSPASRWYPVLQRYITYLAARVRELGGDPDAVPPSHLGYWEVPPRGDGGDGPAGPGKTHTGKIAEVIYGCNGRMEGFVLHECCEGTVRLTACDDELEGIVLKACTNRFTVTVTTSAKDPTKVMRFVVRG